jgi:hypothetical protein
MTKFMLLQNYGATLVCVTPMSEWPPRTSGLTSASSTT